MWILYSFINYFKGKLNFDMKLLSTLFLAILCCGLNPHSNAQKISYSMSAEFETDIFWYNKAKSGDRYVGYKLSTGKSLGGESRSGVEIIIYDNHLQVLKKIPLLNGDETVYFNSVKIFSLKEKIFFTYSLLLEKERAEDIMAIEIDPVNLQVSTPKVIATLSKTDKAMKFLFSTYYYLPDVFFGVSNNKKYAYHLTVGSDNKFYFSLLDENLSIVSEKVIDLKSNDNSIFETCSLDDDGNLFITYRNFPDKQETKNIRVYKKDGKVYDFPINLENGAIGRAMWPLPSKKTKQFYFVGSYGLTKNSANGAGFFWGSLDIENNKLNKISQQKHPEDIVELFDKDGWGKTKEKKYGLALEFTPVLHELEDGSINLIGEFRKRESNANMTKFFILSGSILNVHFDKSGLHYARIPKFRSSAGSTIGDTYYAVPYQNKMIVFYNDHTDNLEQDINKGPKGSNNYKNSVLVAATIEPDGKVKREILVNLKDENFLAETEHTYVLVDGQKYMIPFSRIKGLGGIADQKRLATIEIK